MENHEIINEIPNKTMNEIIIATGNKNKLKEFQDLLQGYNISAIPVETKEIQGTAEEVIMQKAIDTYKILGRRCIVEDTSFEDALLRTHHSGLKNGMDFLDLT
jgi:inosine/xanthosine triphosphate pyrophosphatase family protein